MILQGVEFSIFLLIFTWALQQCSANVMEETYGRSIGISFDDVE